MLCTPSAAVKLHRLGLGCFLETWDCGLLEAVCRGCVQGVCGGCVQEQEEALH